MTNSDVTNLGGHGLGGADLLSGVTMWTSGGDCIRASCAHSVHGWNSVHDLLDHDGGYGHLHDDDGCYVMALMETAYTMI